MPGIEGRQKAEKQVEEEGRITKGRKKEMKDEVGAHWRAALGRLTSQCPYA